MTESPSPEAPRRRRRIALAWIAIGLLVLALGAALWSTRTPTGSDAPRDAAAQAQALPSPPSALEPGAQQEPRAEAATPPPAVAGPFGIEGRVVERDGEGLSEVEVEIIGPEGLVATVESELDGGFRTGSLPLALYTLRARREGYADALQSDVVPGGPGVVLELRPGQALRVSVEPSDVAATCHLGGAGLFPSHRVEAQDGACLFTGLPDGTYQLLATAPGLGSRTVGVEIGQDVPARAAPVTLHLAPAGALDVLVGQGQGDAFVALPGALVTLSAEPLHVLAFHDVTDAQGRVRLDGLRAGVWYVSVRAPGYLPQAPVAVRLPRTEPLVVRPDPGVSLAGRVVDAESGAPVGLAQLVARVETPDGGRWLVERDNLDVLNRLVRRGGTSLGRPRTSFRSAANGAFTLGGLPAGRITLEARKEGWVAVGAPVTIELGARGSARALELRVTRGAPLAGRVVGPGGGGLSGATVRWRLPGDDVWGWRDTVSVDARGEFVLTGVAPQVELEAAAPGYTTRLVSVARAADAAGRTVQLEPLAGRIVGRVTGPRGPVVGAQVRRAETGTDPLSCMTETDREGRFELPDCGSHGVLLEVVGPSMAPLYARAAPGDELELEAGRGATVHGEVVHAGRAEALAEAVLTLEASLPIAGSERRHAFVRSHTFGSGGFELSYVPAGQYEVRIEAPGTAPWRATKQLEEGGRSDLGRIELASLGALEGQVLDALGAPVAEARIAWGGASGQEAVSDGEGRFSLSGVAAGPVEVHAAHWLVGRGRARVTLEAGGVARVNVRLDEALDAGDEARWLEALGAQGVALEPDEGGLVVGAVAEDSQWSDAGLERGDYVESVRWRGGQIEALTVVREGQRRRLGL